MLQTINTRIPCSLYIWKQEPRHKHILTRTLLPRLEPYPMLKSMTRHMLSLEKSLGVYEKKPLLLFLPLKRTIIYAQPRNPRPCLIHFPWKLDKMTLLIPRLKAFLLGWSFILGNLMPSQALEMRVELMYGNRRWPVCCVWTHLGDIRLRNLVISMRSRLGYFSWPRLIDIDEPLNHSLVLPVQIAHLSPLSSPLQTVPLCVFAEHCSPFPCLLYPKMFYNHVSRSLALTGTPRRSFWIVVLFFRHSSSSASE